MSPVPGPASVGLARAPRAAWATFAAMFALMVLNFVDRQIVVSMFPHLHEAFGLSDRELGWLVSVVSVAIAIFTVPIAVAADRFGRVPSTFAMALVWSLATIACALAATHGQLVAARAIVGVGEAAYAAVGAAILASAFPERQRSTVLSAFLAAAVLGSVVGVALGGAIAERWGWRAAFGIAGAPGVVMAFVLLAVGRDEPRAAADAPRAGSIRRVAAELWRPRTLAITCLGGGLQLVTVSAIYAWLPSHFHRAYGLAPPEAGARAALVVLAAGVGGIAWGVLADRLGTRFAAARLHVPAALALATAVLLVAAFALVPPGAAQLALIVAGAVAMTCSIGPAAAVVIDVVPPSVRASAASVLALAQNLVGLAVGPLLAGWLSDRHGLDVALSIVPLASVLAAVAFAAGARTYVDDRARAARPLVAMPA